MAKSLEPGGSYYRKLAGEKLRRAYQIAPPRIQQYLQSEIDFTAQKVKPDNMVLELGCGYGRIFPKVARKAKLLIGIDTSLTSLQLGQKINRKFNNCLFLQMDALHLAFQGEVFDLVVCIQNGISAFRVDQKSLIQESLRVAKKGSRVLFSSYSDKIWKARLDWFQLQADAGLIGEVDCKKTRHGVIICKDGFAATTVGKNEFLSLTSNFHVDTRIIEIDESSLFCEIIKH